MRRPFLQSIEIRSSHQTIAIRAMSSPAPRPIVLSTQDKFTKEIRDGGVPIAELKWLWNPLFVDLQEVSAEVLTDANAE